MNEETRNIPPIVAYARQMPDRVAYRMLPSGATVTWRELEQRSRRCAAALLAAGLRTGDVVAVFLETIRATLSCCGRRIASVCTTRPSAATSSAKRRSTSSRTAMRACCSIPAIPRPNSIRPGWTRRA